MRLRQIQKQVDEKHKIDSKLQNYERKIHNCEHCEWQMTKPDDCLVAVVTRGRGADSTCTVRCCCRMCSGMRDTREWVPPVLPAGADGADNIVADAKAGIVGIAVYEGFGGK